MKFKISEIIFILFVFFLLNPTFSFILQVREGYKRCFKSEPSPDKTLQTKFGFPRQQRFNCNVLFTVNLIEEGEITQNIYHDLHNCHQTSPGQPTVIKHTIQSHSQDSQYQICVEVLDDSNGGLFVQVNIGEKMNPLLYISSDEKLPLVKSADLINLDLIVQSIRRSVGWSGKMVEKGKKKGDMIEASLNELNDFTLNATIFQIIFLIIYAITWIMFIKTQKANRI